MSFSSPPQYGSTLDPLLAALTQSSGFLSYMTKMRRPIDVGKALAGPQMDAALAQWCGHWRAHYPDVRQKPFERLVSKARLAVGPRVSKEHLRKALVQLYTVMEQHATSAGHFEEHVGYVLDRTFDALEHRGAQLGCLGALCRALCNAKESTTAPLYRWIMGPNSSRMSEPLRRHLCIMLFDGMEAKTVPNMPNPTRLMPSSFSNVHFNAMLVEHRNGRYLQDEVMDKSAQKDSKARQSPPDTSPGELTPFEEYRAADVRAQRR